jgi:transcriptional regulator with XRE-family HTH domain
MAREEPTTSHDRRSAAFGALIRAARERVGLTQEDLAQASGLSRPTIDRVEAGATVGIGADEVRSLCQALDIDSLYAAYALGYIDTASLPELPLPQSQTTSVDEVERFLTSIRDDWRQPRTLRVWAQTQLDQIARTRDAVREKAVRSPDRPAQLAAALGLDHVPTLGGKQRRALESAVAHAEADADHLYGGGSTRAVA